MTPSQLKAHVLARGTETHFFDRQTMKFFGDSMRNYGVRDGGTIYTYEGVSHEVWELYRKRPVKHGLKHSTYFDKTTFNCVFPEKG